MLSITGLVGATGFGVRVRSEWRPVKAGLLLFGRALIDSGADISCINNRMLTGWLAEPRSGKIQGVNATVPCPMYKVNLVLRVDQEEWFSPELLVAGLNQIPGEAVALIGWDVLKRTDLSLKATLGQFELVMY